MTKLIYVFLSDDVLRMCEVHEINPQSYMVDSLQEHIHAKSVIRACTKFNQGNETCLDG